ncbi:MAG TPA: metallopeptidase TldD-related protein [bacterium]|jgi:predicted Zn-dependent protease
MKDVMVWWRPLILACCLIAGPARMCLAADPVNLLDVMQQELQRSMSHLGQSKEAPLYYLGYTVTERHTYEARMVDGALAEPQSTNRKNLDVDVRVGSMALDNTHQIREGSWRDNDSRRRMVDFPMETDAAAIRASLWNETEFQFRQAQERYTKVVANRQVKVEEQDTSQDFSTAQPQQFSEAFTLTAVDQGRWQSILKRVGKVFMDSPFVQESSARLSVNDQNVFMVNSEGSRLQHCNHYLRLRMTVSGMAADGMKLERNASYDAATPEGMPSDDVMLADAQRIVSELQSLINAPLVEPYIGPAILRSRASAVFFHEIFGHRIESHRQKSETEGQTFTKKVGQPVLPDFISVYDDPTQAKFKGVDLRGYYTYDDEGIRAQRVTVVDKGVLRNFLTSRSPIANFPQSNGHGRRECGQDVCSRQANLMVTSEKVVPYEQLRKLLIETCKKQGKPYGLIFDDISGGFTMTRRQGPQAFKVEPLLVYRVYADGRPDEVIRGVDIVGTPLTSFSKIIMAGNDDAVFNGTCGAESGWVPVSAISPSVLVSEIEVEKKQKEQEKPPILPPPGHDPQP